MTDQHPTELAILTVLATVGTIIAVHLARLHEDYRYRLVVTEYSRYGSYVATLNGGLYTSREVCEARAGTGIVTVGSWTYRRKGVCVALSH